MLIEEKRWLVQPDSVRRAIAAPAIATLKVVIPSSVGTNACGARAFRSIARKWGDFPSNISPPWLMTRFIAAECGKSATERVANRE